MAINTENIKSQMRKGFLEYCILLIIDKKPAYASDIIVELKNAELIGESSPKIILVKNPIFS